jgi:hypothetical protein
VIVILARKIEQEGIGKGIELKASKKVDRIASVMRNRAADLKFIKQVTNLTIEGINRPQGDSNPCYRRERAVSWAG